MDAQKPYSDSSMWYSRLSDSRGCFRYYQEKHLKKSLEQTSGLDAEFGTAIHLGLNSILLGEDGIPIFDMYMDSIKGKPLQRFKFDWEALRSMGPVFLSRFERLHAKKFKPFKMEERIYGSIGDHPAEGTPDFLGDFEGIPSVVDFKTSSSKYADEKILCDDQMPLYAHLAKQSLGYVAEQVVYVVFVKDFNAPSIQIKKSVLTDSNISNKMKNIKMELDELRARTQFPMNTSHCVRGSIICAAFSKCFGGSNGKNE